MTSSGASDQSQIIANAVADELTQNVTVHLNLSQPTIIITEDKVRLCLIDHLKYLRAKEDWVAPAGILLAILTTFATTTFRDFVFDAAEWKAIFIVAAVLTASWLAKSLIRLKRAKTVNDVVVEMKKQGQQKGT